MATDYARLPKLKGDVTIAGGDTPANSTTPAQAQPAGTKLIGFGEQALSGPVNRAVGAVQENLDLVHASVFGEVAVPEVFEVLGSIQDDGGDKYAPVGSAGTPARMYVAAGGNSAAKVNKIVSLLDENFEEIFDDAGVKLEAILIGDAFGLNTLTNDDKIDVHAASNITAMSKHTVTCAAAAFNQNANPANSLRPACPGDSVVIAGNHANNDTDPGTLDWVVHSVRNASDIEVRCVQDPSRALDDSVAIQGTVKIVSNGEFFVNPIIQITFDPNGITSPPTELNVVVGISRQPISSVAVPATSKYPFASGDLVKATVRTAEEQRDAAGGALSGRYPDPELKVPNDRSKGWNLWDDFASGGLGNGSLGELAWFRNDYGGGGSDAAVVLPDEAKRIGVRRLRAGAAGAGAGVVWTLESVSGDVVGCVRGTAHEDLWLRFSIKLEELNNARYWVGLVDKNDQYPVDAGAWKGVLLRMNAPGAGTDPWNALAKAANETATATDVQTSGNWVELWIHLSGTDTAKFYIDEVLKATINDVGRFTGSDGMQLAIGLESQGNEASMLIDLAGLSHDGLNR